MARRGENIYKRKDGRWEARQIIAYDSNGKAKYRSAYAKSYREARQKKRELQEEVERSLKEPMSEEILFSDLAKTWLENLSTQIKDSTYCRYRFLLERYLLPYWGREAIGELSNESIENYFQMLLLKGKQDGSGLSGKMVSDIKSVMKQIFVYARLRGFFYSCNLDLITLKQESRSIRVLTLQEQESLERELCLKPSSIKISIYLCLYTGLRIGELCALRKGDVDWEHKLLSVERTMLRLTDYSPEAKRKTKIVEDTPKSTCSIRKIPIPDCIFPVIERYYCNLPDDAYFSTGLATKYMEPRSMENHFARILEACQILHANFHTLRHTFATRCIEAGFEAKALSEILGHSNVTITLNRYVHPSMNLKQSNMNRLETLFPVE